MRQDLDLWLNIVTGFCRSKSSLLKEQTYSYLCKQGRCSILQMAHELPVSLFGWELHTLARRKVHKIHCT